jgi:hypothetical protein
MEIGDYVRQSAYSDPGRHARLFDALPDEIEGLTAVVRNVIVHYRAAGIEFSGDLTFIDEVAELLLRADEGDREAERELLARYDDRLRPAGKVRSHSPTGEVREVTLTASGS